MSIMVNSLYYHILWPESQKWLEQKDPIEDGLVIPGEDQSAFVDKDLYEFIGIKKAGSPSSL